MEDTEDAGENTEDTGAELAAGGSGEGFGPDEEAETGREEPSGVSGGGGVSELLSARCHRAAAPKERTVISARIKSPVKKGEEPLFRRLRISFAIQKEPLALRRLTFIERE